MIGSLAANVRKFIDAIEKPVLILDSDFIVIAVNKYCDEHFRKGEEITGKWWEIDNKYEYMSLPLKKGKDGKEYTCLIIERTIRDEETDETTGIANRRGLECFYRAVQGDCCFDYICLEIENYLFVKDIYGKEKGRTYIREAWQKIEAVFENEKEAFFARILGGQFVVMIHSRADSEEKIANYCRQIVNDFKGGVKCDDMTIETSVNIGIVREQDASESIDDILHKCKLALRQSKKNSHNGYVFYNHIEGQMREIKELEAMMADELAKGRFIPYLQPKMNALTNTIYGAEALVRWNHSKQGLISPGKFIPFMEENGFIREIDFSILEQVCQLKKKWREENKPYKDLIISVNMSRVHFFDKDFVDRILNIINKYDIPKQEIDLEITEGVFFEDAKIIKDTIAELKNKGFVISIDDFGSSYSSLGMLKDVKADILKLDKTFIDTTGVDDKGTTVIRNVIAMGNDLKMQVISEGVETEEEKKLVTGFGCELIQGYYYSKPLPVNEFETYAENNCGESFLHVYFPLKENVLDETNALQGEMKGENLEFRDDAIVFPGGEEMQNVIILPQEIMASESYTISMWLYEEEYVRWSSAFFVRYKEGFLSFVPYIREDSAVFRICDDRKEDSWNDIFHHPIPLQEWTHVAVTLDAFSETARLYINGEMVHFIEHVPVLYNVERIVLGGDYYQKSFHGKMKNLRIVGSAQSSEKIKQIYMNEK